MEEILFTILTDEEARNHETLEAEADKSFTVGAPWYFKDTEAAPKT